jgi:hypothetical protein
MFSQLATETKGASRWESARVCCQEGGAVVGKQVLHPKSSLFNIIEFWKVP